MSCAWKERAEGCGVYARRAEKGNCRLGAPPGEKSLGVAGVNWNRGRRMLCLCVGGGAGWSGVEGQGLGDEEEGGRELGAREGRGCPLPAKLPRAAAGGREAGGGEVERDDFSGSLRELVGGTC